MGAGEIIGLVVAIVAAVGGLTTAIVALIKLSQQKKKVAEDEGQFNGTVASDLGYIKAGVDDLKRDLREIRKEQGELSERVTRVEESTKQAHKRIDEIKRS